jgi:hypothetical protein
MKFMISLVIVLLGVGFNSFANEVCSPSYMGDGVICNSDKVNESGTAAGNIDTSK